MSSPESPLRWLSIRPLWLLLVLVAVPLLRAEVRVGQPMPELASLGLEGQLPKLKGRVVLLDVWASWCAPCKASFPALARLHEERQSQGLVIVAVSVDRRAADYGKFLEKHRPPFTTLRDPNQTFARTFSPPAMPTTYLIDRDGIVRAIEVGFHGERTLKAWHNLLNALLAELPARS